MCKHKICNIRYHYYLILHVILATHSIRLNMFHYSYFFECRGEWGDGDPRIRMVRFTVKRLFLYPSL